MFTAEVFKTRLPRSFPRLMQSPNSGAIFLVAEIFPSSDTFKGVVLAGRSSGGYSAGAIHTFTGAATLVDFEDKLELQNQD